MSIARTIALAFVVSAAFLRTLDLSAGEPMVESGSLDLVWRKIAQGPFNPRDGAGLVFFNKKLWLLGGWQNSVPEHDGIADYNDVWNSPNGTEWTFVNRAPWGGPPPWGGRHCAGSVVFRNRIWVISGDGHPDVWSSRDGKTWEQAAAHAPWGQRYAPYVTVFRDKIWLMGGISFWDVHGEFTLLDAPLSFNDVWCSSDGVRWELVLDHAPWSPRGLIHGSVVFKGRCWIMGGGIKGRDTLAEYNDVWNTADGVHWNEVTSSAPWAPRTHANIIVFNRRIWTFGGSVGHQTSLSNEVWSSPDGRNWKAAGGVPWSPTHATSLVVFRNRLLMVAGYLRNDIWEMAPDGTNHLP